MEKEALEQAYRGSAFPADNPGGEWGLTKLEYYSCHILQGLISGSNPTQKTILASVEEQRIEQVKLAVLLAKELIKQTYVD